MRKNPNSIGRLNQIKRGTENIMSLVQDLLNLLKESGVKEEELIPIRLNSEAINQQILNCLNGMGTDFHSNESGNEGFSNEIDEYCTGFVNGMKGVGNASDMVEKLKDLISKKELNITKDGMGKHIDLKCLDYEICVLNLGDLSSDEGYEIIARDSSINSSIKHYETNKTGMMQISNGYSLWEIPNQTDIENILKTLAGKYSLKAYKQGGIHDEDIAFLMLIIQGDGEFLLTKEKNGKSYRVLKCYKDFRGFKNMREKGTGQIMLIRKK